MEFTEEQIAKKEQEEKNLYFQRLYEVKDTLDSREPLLQRMSELNGLNNFHMNNPVTLAMNKINEIAHEFKKYGISLYVIADNDNLLANDAGCLIISDVSNRLNDAFYNITEYTNLLGDIMDKRLKRYNDAKVIHIADFIPGHHKPSIDVTKKEADLLASKIDQINKLNDDIFNYNYRESIVDSMSLCTEFVKKPSMIEDTYYHDIVPTVKQLGLADQLPLIRQQIIAKCEQNIPKLRDGSMDMNYYRLRVPNLFQENELKK